MVGTTQKNSSRIVAYALFLEQLKIRVQQAQCKASLAVNNELVLLYWDIGKSIVENQEKEKWGAQVIEKLCRDLQRAFPGIQGFSRANIFKMRAFYLAYRKVSQPLSLLAELPIFRIPWGHNVLIITKAKNIDECFWYAEQAIEHGLSRASLEAWIISKAYYCESELEHGLVSNIQKLLLELGKGFAFIGRQYHLEVAGDDYYLDLLFYHTRLHCYCIVELKNTDFKPEYTGKLNFYLSAVDDLLKQPEDNPSIGILLCKSKKKLKVEYALRDVNKPIGVSDYVTKILDVLPKRLQNNLPTHQDIEATFVLEQKKRLFSKKMGRKRRKKSP